MTLQRPSKQRYVRYSNFLQYMDAKRSRPSLANKGLDGLQKPVSYIERKARFSIRSSLPNWVKERPAEKQFDAYRKSGNTRHFTKVSRQVSGILCRFRNRIPILLASLVTIESTWVLEERSWSKCIPRYFAHVTCFSCTPWQGTANWWSVICGVDRKSTCVFRAFRIKLRFDSQVLMAETAADRELLSAIFCVPQTYNRISSANWITFTQNSETMDFSLRFTYLDCPERPIFDWNTTVCSLVVQTHQWVNSPTNFKCTFLHCTVFAIRSVFSSDG